MEDDLRESETRSRYLMQSSMDGIHVLDVQGNVVEANDAFCKMLGYMREEISSLNLTWLKDTEGRYLTVNKLFLEFLQLKDTRQAIGKTDFDLHPPELAEKYLADDAEVMATGRQKHAVESAFDGRQKRWVETFKTPIVDSRVTVLGTVGVAKVITERMRAEEALRFAAVTFETPAGLAR